jgi:hypothetical protein
MGMDMPLWDCYGAEWEKDLPSLNSPSFENILARFQGNFKLTSL